MKVTEPVPPPDTVAAAIPMTPVVLDVVAVIAVDGAPVRITSLFWMTPPPEATV
jgi:hypothetical protein